MNSSLNHLIFSVKKKKGEMMALNEKELLEKVNSIFVVRINVFHFVFLILLNSQ